MSPPKKAEAVQGVEEVVQNGIIRGSKEYSKDQYISGATQASERGSSPTRTESGKIFYKLQLQVIDPRNFKGSGDIGTLASGR